MKAMLEGPVGGTIFRLTLPMMVGTVALILFGLVDAYFVARLGTRELAALSFTFPVTMFVTFLGIGMGIGTSATVARAIGAGAAERAEHLATASLLLAVTVGTCMAVAGWLSMDMLFRAMGADALTRVSIHAYMSVWFISAPLLLMQTTANGALRATGNTRTPALLMTLAAILNGIFDPLLIFGVGPFPALGIRGAAVASLLAWSVSASVLIFRLRRDRYLEPLSDLRLNAMLRTWRSHLTISGPAAAANMLTPVATGIITAVLAGYGAAAVAAYGVSIRVESLALLVILALSASLPPFISQNFGAGRLDRVRDALRRVIVFTLLWQGAVYLVMLPLVPRIAVLFTDDAGVADVLATILYVLPLSYGCQGVVVLCNSSLNALHEPRRALALSVLRWGAFYVPGALLGVAMAGVPGLIVGAALGNVAAAVLAVFWIWRSAADNGAILAHG